MKRVRKTQVMLKGMSHTGNFDEARRARLIRVYVLRDQFVIFSAHDPIILAVQNQSRDFQASPGSSKVQFLQLLIKDRRPPVELRMIFAFRPKLGEFGDGRAEADRRCCL